MTNSSTGRAAITAAATEPATALVRTAPTQFQIRFSYCCQLATTGIPTAPTNHSTHITNTTAIITTASSLSNNAVVISGVTSSEDMPGRQSGSGLAMMKTTISQCSTGLSRLMSFQASNMSSQPATTVLTEAKRGHNTKMLISFWGLLSILFFQVSGGPFGVEGVVGYGGPLLSIIGLFVGRCIYSLPEALVTAELSTAFPENSGYYAWVTCAFGSHWGFQKAWWSGVANLLDIATYPVLFLEYLRGLAPCVGLNPWRWLILIPITTGLAFINWMGGLQGVAYLEHTFIVMTLSPFIPFVWMAFQQADLSNLGTFRSSKFSWMRYLSILLWNVLNWDAAGCVAGEVANPDKVFPKAMNTMVLVVAVVDLVPLMAGLGVEGDQDKWHSGYFTVLGQQVGGRWLAIWMVVAAAVCQLGNFMAALSAQAYQMEGMASRGMVPAFLGRRDKRTGSPTWAIVMTVLPALAMQSFSFEQLVDMMIIVQCAAQLLMFGTFLYLQFLMPDLSRPFRIPLPNWACAILLLPACTWMIVLLGYPFYYIDQIVYATFSIGVFAAGVCIYHGLDHLKARYPAIFVHEKLLTAREEIIDALTPP